jgi:uncharacterized protein (TIGR02391 family)
MIPTFPDSHLLQIARALEGAATHRELSDLFRQCSINERGGDPKWERIKNALVARQAQDGCGNNVGAFIQAVLDPARFSGRPDEHQHCCRQVNLTLAFSGLHISDHGSLVPVPAATTVSEAQARADRLRQNLVARGVHQRVLDCCRAELVRDNYFHAVLEACKSVADAIRTKSGIDADGAPLADAAFGGRTPRLALSTLQTETERSEQSGFLNLLKGMFGTFRNPAAHELRTEWLMLEADALDLLSLASYLLRRIDGAVRATWVSRTAGSTS